MAANNPPFTFNNGFPTFAEVRGFVLYCLVVLLYSTYQSQLGVSRALLPPEPWQQVADFADTRSNASTSAGVPPPGSAPPPLKRAPGLSASTTTPPPYWIQWFYVCSSCEAPFPHFGDVEAHNESRHGVNTEPPTSGYFLPPPPHRSVPILSSMNMPGLPPSKTISSISRSRTPPPVQEGCYSCHPCHMPFMYFGDLERHDALCHSENTGPAASASPPPLPLPELVPVSSLGVPGPLPSTTARASIVTPPLQQYKTLHPSRKRRQDLDEDEDKGYRCPKRRHN